MIPCDWLNKKNIQGHKEGVRGFFWTFYEVSDSLIGTEFIRYLLYYRFGQTETIIKIYTFAELTSAFACIAYLSYFIAGVNTEMKTGELSIWEILTLVLYY